MTTGRINQVDTSLPRMRGRRTPHPKRNSSQTSFVTSNITEAYHNKYVKLHTTEAHTWTPRDRKGETAAQRLQFAPNGVATCATREVTRDHSQDGHVHRILRTEKLRKPQLAAN